MKQNWMYKDMKRLTWEGGKNEIDWTLENDNNVLIWWLTSGINDKWNADNFNSDIHVTTAQFQVIEQLKI